jgi:hypothetical protein
MRIYRNEKVVETHALNWHCPCFNDLQKFVVEIPRLTQISE